jgi:hypothetical protein
MTPEQQRIITSAITLGVDRETAAAYARTTAQEIELASNLYPDFATELQHAEAAAELSHIRAITEAAKDPKLWRASMFWLKARKPDRYGRPARQITIAQLNQFAESLFAALATEFPDEQIHRIRTKIRELITEIENAS